MAYSELVKNLDHVRSYMREFYLYGFKSREEYDTKSLRSYDDEKRRLESWLGAHIGFRRTTDGKYTFISIDSRHVRHDPLYAAWKAKSFTNGDITLHFILFDIFATADAPLSLAEITEKVDGDYLSAFKEPMLFDESTVRKKLKEYAEEGLLKTEKAGKKTLYSLNSDECPLPPHALLDFYSEVAPCGVIGSFLADKQKETESPFAFKHHYMTSSIDSGVLCDIFEALSEKRYVTIETVGRGKRVAKPHTVLPLAVFISVQNGRQHLMAYYPEGKQITSYRIDYIESVKPLEVCPDFETHRERLEHSKRYMWGVLTRNNEKKLQRISFTVRIGREEEYVYKRLLREKRCGHVERIDEHSARFTAEVYDLNEMIPWVRTFICRITALEMSDKRLEEKFKRDLKKMYKLYDLGGDDDAV